MNPGAPHLLRHSEVEKERRNLSPFIRSHENLPEKWSYWLLIETINFQMFLSGRIISFWHSLCHVWIVYKFFNPGPARRVYRFRETLVIL